MLGLLGKKALESTGVEQPSSAKGVRENLKESMICVCTRKSKPRRVKRSMRAFTAVVCVGIAFR